MEDIRAGTINEAGLIYSLTRKGLTIDNCGSELISNSLDAGAKNVIYYVKDNFIYLIDDGDGMDKNECINMFDLNRQNHKNDKSEI